jgi:hypothetical protein
MGRGLTVSVYGSECQTSLEVVAENPSLEYTVIAKYQYLDIYVLFGSPPQRCMYYIMSCNKATLWPS